MISNNSENNWFGNLNSNIKVHKEKRCFKTNTHTGTIQISTKRRKMNVSHKKASV